MHGASTAKVENNTVEIEIDNPADAWNYTCPYGHRAFEPVNGGIWCKACDNNDSISDAHYHEIRKKSTGERIDFDRVALVASDD